MNLRKFERNFLSFNDMKRATRILSQMVQATAPPPDLIFGANDGGLVAAAAMNKGYLGSITVGAVYINRNNRTVKLVSLPHNPDFKPINDIKNILVVDPKLKSARSARVIKATLQQRYQNAAIQYAVVLVYGGWKESRGKRVDRGIPWPVILDPDTPDSYTHNLLIYAAY